MTIKPLVNGSMMHLGLAFAFVTAACTPNSLSVPVANSDPYRPFIHFAPTRNWMNDPNGPVRVNGRYHLFYQYNPGDTGWGDIAWGHTSSADLFNWSEHEIAIPRTDSTMMFSGGVVIDSLGTAGLCSGPQCLVAIYTAAHEETKQQTQSLAYSANGGDSWVQFTGNPVLQIGSTEFRDPFVFWHNASESWIMAITMSQEHAVRFYRSGTLREWQLLSEFGNVGATGGVWECPVLVPLPVQGTNTHRWMLKVDLNPGHIAGGSGAQYFTGTFDGQRFVADDSGTRWVDYGPDFYCAQPWQPANADGSSTWIAWMSNWSYAADTPTGEWRGMMTLPRTIMLREQDGRFTLTQAPQDLQPLRGPVQRYSARNATIDDATVLDITPGKVFEAELTIAAGTATEVGLLIRHSAQQHVLVSYDPVRSVVAIDRRQGGAAFHPDFASRYEAPVPPDSTITLRLVVDASSVELFTNDGATVLSALMFPSSDSNALALFTKGGLVTSLSLSVWPLRAQGEI